MLEQLLLTLSAAALPVLLGLPWIALSSRKSGACQDVLFDAWATGFSSFAICSLIASLLGKGVSSALLMAALLSIVALALCRRRRQSPAIAWRHPTNLAALVVLLFSALSSTTAGSPWSTFGDDPAHVAEVRQVAQGGEIFPRTTFHQPGEVPGPDPRFGVVHSFYGALSRWTRAEPAEVWIAARALGTALTWLAFFRLASGLLPATPALVATILAMLLFGGSRFPIQLVAMYPIWIGIAMAWAATARWIERLKSAEVGWCDLFWLPALGLTHYFSFLALLILLGCALLSRGLRRSAGLLLALGRPGAFAFLFTAGCMAARIDMSYESANPIHSGAWNIAEVGSRLLVYQPTSVLEAIGPLGLLAPILLLLGWRSLASSGWSRTFLLLSTSLPLLVPLNPLVVTLLRPFLGFLLYRMVLLSLWPIALTALLFRWLPRRFGRPVGLALAAVLLVRLVLPSGEPPHQYDAIWQSHARELAETIPPTATIVSDPYTMLGLPAFASISVAAVPDGRSSPRDPRAFERLFFSSVATDPASTPELAIAACHRIGATHAVLTRWEQAPTGYLYSPADRSAAGMTAAWAERGAELIYSGSTFDLYELPEPHDSPLPELDGLLGSGAVARQPELSVTLEPEHAPRGEAVRLRLFVREVSPAPGILIPRLFVRLDHQALWGGDSLGGKPYRKLRERIAGSSQRQRFDFELTPTLYLEALLNGGKLDMTLDLQIGENLQPGNYDVQLLWSWEERTHREWVSDTLWNHDSYSGLLVAELEVLP